MSQLQVTGEAKIRDLQGPVVANSGVITALDGLPSQYVRGDGTLADIPSVTGGGSSVSYYLNGSVNQGTFAGSTYYQMSKDAITGVGTNFSSSTDGLLAQFITDANDPDVSSIPSGNWNIEFYMGVSASSGALASFYVEFYKWNGSAFTFLASNVATPEFLTNTTTVDAYFTSVAFPETPLATTDRLAIRVYANVASKTVTMYTEDNRLCQIVTTFSKGLLSMNSLTDQEQYLTVGTAGTDFNIVSSIDTHTFNIPTASSTKRGLLSTTDWSTFNNKVPYTGATGPVNLGAYDLTVNGLTIGKGGGGFASNTAIGLNVLASNAGINNLGVGGLALFSNTIGVQNAALGVVSLYSNTSGSYNSAVGYQSIYSNTTGTSNNALGSGSLYSNTTGANNVAIGNAALFGNVSGDGNTSIGVSSLQNSTGVRNTAIGYDAGNLIMTGSYNTIIGSYTGTSSMSSNVILADGQGNIRYRFDGTNNNFYENVNLGENTYTGGFVQANGTSVLSGTISLKQNGFIPAATGYATIGSVSAGKLSIYFGESGLKSVELQNDLLTASRTYDFPDLSGTLALLEGTQTFSGVKTFSENVKIDAGIRYKKNPAIQTASAGYLTTYGTSGFGLSFFDGDSGNESKLAFNTASNYTYTFPASSGTIALTGDLSAYVTLSTAQTISGNKTFSGTSLFTGTGTFNSSLQAAIGIIFPTSGVVSNGAGIVGLGAYSGGLRTAFNGGYTSDLAFQMGANYVYTFPASSGTLALTSNIPSVSGTSGQVTYFNGTSSVTGSSNHFWDATNNRLGIGLTNPQRSLEIYSATADSHLRLSGSAPSVSMGEAITGSVYQAKFGLATAAGQYVSGAVAGDFVMLSQTGATIFATSATEKMRLTSGGNLGLGTTSPNANGFSTALTINGVTNSALELSANGTNQGYLFSSTSIMGLVARTNIPLLFYTNDTERMRITSGGNVGIGTLNPLKVLHIAQGGNNNGILWTDDAAGNYRNEINNSYAGGVAASNLMTFKVSNGTTIGQTTVMNLTGGGNVGIGTSSPSQKLHITGTGDIVSLVETTAGSFAQYRLLSGGGNAWVLGTQSDFLSGGLVFRNGTDKMLITSGGNVLIGTTSGTARLEILGQANEWAISATASTTSGQSYGAIIRGGTNSSDLAFRVNNAANNTTYLSVRGDGLVSMSSLISTFTTLNVANMWVNPTDGTISRSTASSGRFKENIKDWDGNGLNTILALKPKTFTYKADYYKNPELEMLGLIAEEVAEVSPFLAEFENEDRTGQVENVRYATIVVPLIKAIQELEARVKQLENK